MDYKTPACKTYVIILRQLTLLYLKCCKKQQQIKYVSCKKSLELSSFIYRFTIG